MRVAAVTFFLFLIALLGACNPAAAPVPVSSRPALSNDTPAKAPINEMTWTGSDGKQTSLADLEGKVVILDFWATYCPPCIKEIPHLNTIHAKFDQAGVKVIGLNSGGPDDRPKIPRFLRKTPIDYDMAFPDDDLQSYIFKDDDRIPQTLVFDRGGRLVKRIVGFDDGVKRDLDDAVRSAMSAQ